MVEKRHAGARQKKALSVGHSRAGIAKRKQLESRGHAILSEASRAGFLRGEKTERVGGRITSRLLSAAKSKSGIQSQTELLEYALAKVALEDNYGASLLAMKGSVPDDVEL